MVQMIDNTAMVKISQSSLCCIYCWSNQLECINMGARITVFVGLMWLAGILQTTESLPTSQLSRSTMYDRDLSAADKYLREFDRIATDLTTESSEASWDYETNLTKYNLEKTVNLSVSVSEFFLDASENAAKIKTLDLPSQMQRQINIIRRNADSASNELRKEVRELEGKMTSIFGKAKVCKSHKHKGCKYLSLEPDLTKIMRKSRNLDKLLFAWKGWRDAVGPPMKGHYERIVDLLNIGAREHGWIDYGDFLRSEYEQGDDFELNLRRVWESIKPLYNELHAYVRYRLRNLYGSKLNISMSGTIPAHILGDMYAQNWENIFDVVKPYSNVQNMDITEAMKRKNYTIEKVFKLAESFFVSVGLYKMPDSFWKKSVIKRLKGRDMVCHASAWDFSKGDVRVKMCTQINQEHLITVHHEMGHIEYFIAYQNQPYAFRNGANPGFHEAIGDTISLSVETRSYLKQIGLLDGPDNNDEESMISFLLRQALRRVAPIPYNYLVDKWRWRVFAGNITENNYNSEWWKLRTKYQGVSPPVKRKEDDFDPASKYHIGANVPYIAAYPTSQLFYDSPAEDRAEIGYFVSYVLQFQLHRSLCREAGITEPIHRCSIYQSEKAGKKFRTMLEAGRSKPWPKILKAITGERELSANAINEYFAPLFQWLVAYRNRHGYPVGWAQEDLSTKVLHRKAGKFESGQERSGILKTNNKGISLSINIPSSLTGKKASATKNNDVHADKGEDDKISVPLIDLAKLLSSGEHFSVTSSETNANSKDGATTIENKEFTLNNDDDKGENKSGNKTDTAKDNAGDKTDAATPNSSGIDGQNATANSNVTSKGNTAAGNSSNTTAEEMRFGNGTVADKNGLANGTNEASPNANSTANSTVNNEIGLSPNGSSTANSTTNSALINGTASGQNITSFANNTNIAQPINQTLAWQGDMVANSTKAALVNATGVDVKSQNTQNTTAPVQNATTRDTSPCIGSKRSHSLEKQAKECKDAVENPMDTISVSPGELIQHVLMKKVKNMVQKTLPQADVEKTNTGFTVNFDLNPKDEIPSRVQDVTGKTRQQHVNVFIAPKGVVVKPKTSEQLMKPSFVPVQNKDNLELRGGK